MNPFNEHAEREAFEADAQGRRWETERDAAGFYRHCVQDSWEGWLACAKAKAGEMGAIREALQMHPAASDVLIAGVARDVVKELAERREQVDSLMQEHDEIECALPVGSRHEPDRTLADRVRELAVAIEKAYTALANGHDLHPDTFANRTHLAMGLLRPDQKDHGWHSPRHESPQENGTPPDPHAALKDAVVEAAMAGPAWFRLGLGLEPGVPGSVVEAGELNRACSALRAAQQPKDPVREARDAVAGWLNLRREFSRPRVLSDVVNLLDKALEGRK